MPNTLVQPYLFFGGRCEEARRILPHRARRRSRSCSCATRTARSRHRPACSRPASRTRSCTPPSASARPRSWRPTVCNGKTELSRLLALARRARRSRGRPRFRRARRRRQVQMPLTKTFWSPRFGMLTDRFGLGWMVSVVGVNVRYSNEQRHAYWSARRKARSS